MLLGLARPTSMETALPPLLRFAWGLLLAGGGVAVLTGLYWPNPYTGVEIKRPGFVACGFATLAYGVALLPFGATGVVVAIFNLSFAAACAVRLRQVTRRVRQARGHLREVRRRVTPRRD